MRLERPAWMADAACREHPEVDFFPTPANALPARLVCFGCIVRDECGAYGRKNGEVGVWGGQLLKAPRLPAPSTRRRRGVDLDALAVQTASLAAESAGGSGEEGWVIPGGMTSAMERSEVERLWKVRYNDLAKETAEKSTTGDTFHQYMAVLQARAAAEARLLAWATFLLAFVTALLVLVEVIT